MRRTKPRNTDAGGRAGLRRDAVKGVVLHTAVQGISALVLLWIRELVDLGWLDGPLLVLAVIDLATIPPAFIVLRQRIKEIEGGELDAARKY